MLDPLERLEPVFALPASAGETLHLRICMEDDYGRLSPWSEVREAAITTASTPPVIVPGNRSTALFFPAGDTHHVVFTDEGVGWQRSPTPISISVDSRMASSWVAISGSP